MSDTGKPKSNEKQRRRRSGSHEGLSKKSSESGRKKTGSPLATSAKAKHHSKRDSVHKKNNTSGHSKRPRKKRTKVKRRHRKVRTKQVEAGTCEKCHEGNVIVDDEAKDKNFVKHKIEKLGVWYKHLHHEEPIERYNFVEKKAVKGHDVVTLIEKEKLKKGKTEFKHCWEGGEWLFENEKNLKLFIDNPEKYAPQQGGYCSLAMSVNLVADGLFWGANHSWDVRDGKLYLFFSPTAKLLFNAMQEENLKRAVENWKTVKFVTLVDEGEEIDGEKESSSSSSSSSEKK